MITPTLGGYGQVPSNIVITNRATDNALIASICILGRVSSNVYNAAKNVYQIVNKTKNTTTNMSVWPSELLEQLLNEGDDIIVIYNIFNWWRW